MVILFIIGLVCVALAGLKYLEGLSFSLWAYLIVGIVCIVAYVINLVRKKMER